jgi:hypothetical protein
MGPTFIVGFYGLSLVRLCVINLKMKTNLFIYLFIYLMCSMSVHCIIRNNKHQLMHKNIYIIFIRESLLHVSTLLGHLQGD